jgi:hypothetical protein
MATAKPSKTTQATRAKPAEEAEKTSEAGQAKKADSGRFAQFVAARKLDHRRILAVSRRLERLQTEDRLIKLNKRRAKKAASDGGDNAPKETRKPRSGRPVTPRALNAALRGSAISGPTKTRILQAVNHLLGLKKQDKVDLKALF